MRADLSLERVGPSDEIAGRWAPALFGRAATSDDSVNHGGIL